MSDFPQSLECSLRRLAASRTVYRIQRLARTAQASNSETRLLCALAITEMSARPSDVRAIEWVVASLLRSGVLGARAARRGNRLTVGPFQIQGASFALSEAVLQALARLRVEKLDIRYISDVALNWNGPLADRGTIQYSLVLDRAIKLTRRPGVHQFSSGFVWAKPRG